MSNKPRGGKGRRERYSTSVMRVPDPVKPEVEKLIEQFHQARLGEDAKPVTALPTIVASPKPKTIPKPVTGLPEQLPVTLLMEMQRVAYPKEWDGNTFATWCDLEWDWWDEEYDKIWERESLPIAQEFNLLADQVNCTIWQIDNTFAIRDPDDLYDAVAKLLEYNLLTVDIPAAQATARQIAIWICRECDGADNIQSVAWRALQDERLDILAALIGERQTPINRREYWFRKYKRQLAKPKVNYWDWKDNPESREICKELTILLTLPKPSADARQVLECLAENKDPFFKPEFKGKTESDIFAHVFSNLDKVGSLGSHKPEQKQAYRQAFAEWHLAALAQLGQDTLQRIYKIVFGADWTLIQTILNPPLEGAWWEILGVAPGVTKREAKAALKRLAKQWHPDINPSPIAQQQMAKINQAYEQFEQTCNNNN